MSLSQNARRRIYPHKRVCEVQIVKMILFGQFIVKFPLSRYEVRQTIGVPLTA